MIHKRLLHLPLPGSGFSRQLFVLKCKKVLNTGVRLQYVLDGLR